MKKIMIAGCAVLITGLVQAQQPQGKVSAQEPLKQGKVVYEHTVQIQIRVSGLSEEMMRSLPRSRTTKQEVLFGENHSLRRELADDIEADNGPVMAGATVQVRSFGGGAGEVVYTDLETGIVTRQAELATKKYLITDTVRKLNWKLTGESKVILNYLCQKATAQRIGTRSNMTMVNGEMKRETVADTSNFVAWFATSIPVSAAPINQAQLPGMILELDINDGRDVYKATEVTAKVNVADIKEPKNGKKVTQAEFALEGEKLMKEMQQNNRGGGGGVFIRAN